MRRRRIYRTIAVLVVVLFVGGALLSALMDQGQVPNLPEPSDKPPIAGEQPPAGGGQPGGSKEPTAAEEFDLIISGGMVYDGTGETPRRADIGIVADRIIRMGDLSAATAPKRIDATGLAVAPGFIDVHSHTYEYHDPLSLAAVTQGITTQIGGVDGRHHGYPQGGQLPRAVNMGQALEEIEKRGTGVNQALFAGLGTIWLEVIGNQNVRPTAEQMEQMRQMLREAMSEGALGLSSGLDYEPDRFVTTEEIIELAKVAAGYGGVYATHTRGDFSNVRAGVTEALRIGREAGIPVAIQHFKFVGPSEWGDFDDVVDMLNTAVSSGQKVTIDIYPYQAPDFATRTTVGWALDSVAGAADLVEINVSPADPSLVGKRLDEAAHAKGLSPEALAVELDQAGGRATAMLIKEEHIAYLLQLPYTLTSSDGEATPLLSPGDALRTSGLGVHPRSYGSYGRFLRLNREQNLMELETLIRKMTGAAADFYHLRDRGYLRAGAIADIVIFDPDGVREGATFSHPQEYVEGVYHVVVNGMLVIEQEISHEGGAGKAIYRGK